MILALPFLALSLVATAPAAHAGQAEGASGWATTTAWDRAISCAAVHAELASILGTGEANADDRASAARFADDARIWLGQALAERPGDEPATRAALARATQNLDRQIAESGGPDAAEALLDSRLSRCAGVNGASSGDNGFGSAATATGA